MRGELFIGGKSVGQADFTFHLGKYEKEFAEPIKVPDKIEFSTTFELSSEDFSDLKVCLLPEAELEAEFIG